MEQHYLKSGFREKLIEHLFVAEILKCAWQDGKCSIEISKPEVDSGGYDLIAEQNGTIRHIQLKASHRRAKAAKQKIHIALSEKPSGCLIWIFFDEDTLELGPFLFFGGIAGERLPSATSFRIAKHTKGNAKGEKAERPRIREIPKRAFQKLQSGREIYALLFNRES